MSRLLASLAVLCATLPAFAADYNVSASGRCVYEEAGVLKAIPGARVELRDQDFDIPVNLDVVGPVALDVSGNDVCATGMAGSDGSFRLSGRCGDFGPSIFKGTRPDLYVRCSLEGAGGRIFQNSFPWTLYNATSRPRDNNTAHLNAGDVRLPAGPAKTFLSLSYTSAKVKSLLGVSLLPVWTLYPGGRQAVIANSGKTYFASYAGTVFMSIAPGDEANGTVAHEYGHTLQFQSFLQDWATINSLSNTLRAGWEALRHRTGAGHTYSTLSNPVMAFAEGFAEFMEGVVYGSGLPNCSTWQEIGSNESERIQVEGNVACRLWRLYKKWGYKDVWTAQVRAKAVRYDHFFAEYKKIHPDAGSVATPPVLVATTVKLLARPTIVPVILRAAPTFQAPVSTALRYSASLNATALMQPLVRAEGPACAAIGEAYAQQVARYAAGCKALKQGPAALQSCLQRLRQLSLRANALRGFCRTLKIPR